MLNTQATSGCVQSPVAESDDADLVREGEFEDAERVHLANAQVNRERCGRNEPAVEPRAGDDPPPVEEAGCGRGLCV